MLLRKAKFEWKVIICIYTKQANATWGLNEKTTEGTNSADVLNVKLAPIFSYLFKFSG